MTQQAIAVIFARGTGDLVPLLSARLVGGKPMLHYTIQAAQQSAYVKKVYVSTEDERVAAAAAAAGAGVIIRPEAFSQPGSSIDAAVSHAVEALGVELEESGGNLLCLPAVAVFCDTSVIDHAFQTYFQGDYEQLVGLLPENENCLIWQESENHHLEPLIPQPHLRPSGQHLYSEPGVLTIWRVKPPGLPESTSRVGYITLTQRSAFRVDTEYDTWVAERLITPNHLALRCDGSREMGMGHVMRLMYVAEDLRRQDESEWVVRFFIGSDHLEGARLLTQKGFDVDIVRQGDYSHWLRRIEEFNPQVIINDLPFVPAQYVDDLRNLPVKSLTLVDSVADIEPGSAGLETVISHMDEDLGSPHERYHHGLAFAALHPSVIARLEGRSFGHARSGKLRVVVAYGTGDPAQLTQLTLSALAETEGYWKDVSVAVRREQQDEAFWETVRRFRCPVEVLDSPSDGLAELLDQADLSLVSGGITAYECSALGVPAIVLCQNQRELDRMQQFERIGSIVLLGMGPEVSRAQIVRALTRVADDVTLRERMSIAGRSATDGRGVERISQIVRELFKGQTPVAP